MTDVSTYLLVEDGRLGDHDALAELVTSTGGTVVDAVGDGDPRVLAAAFPLASDAVHAAVEATRTGAGAMRAVLCTADADLTGATRARELLDSASAGQTLVTSSTAVLVSHVLPVGSDLVDRGTRRFSAHSPERVYELRTSPAHVESPASNLGWARRAAPGPVVGRAEELAALEAEWRQTLRGGRRAVVLTGEAGIGKTTMAAVLALRVHAQGGLVLYGRWDQDRISPYQAVREALGTYAYASSADRLRSELVGRVNDVARLLPEVGTRLGGLGAPRLTDPERDRLVMFDGIEGWLEAIAARWPVLLVLDDLHWADHASLLLVDHLRCSSAAMPLMVVATGRPGEEAETAPSALLTSPDAADGEVARIPLGGLGSVAVGQLIVNALGRPLLWSEEVQDIADDLARATAGNPLFLQEVLHDLPDGRDLAALRAAQRAMPKGLGDVVRWRLEQLPITVADLLSVASVVGPRFDVELLAEATRTAPLTVGDPLDEARRAGLLRFDEGDDSYTFTHYVIREALQEEASPEHAAVLHRRVAAALADRAAAGLAVRPDEVAYHYLQGVDRDTVGLAVRWAREAAGMAGREAAFETAVDRLAGAADAHDRLAPADPEGRALGCELQLELAEAHDRASQFVARDETFVAAAAMAREIDRTDLLARAALGVGGLTPAITPPDSAAARLVDEAIERLGDRDIRTRVLLLARRARLHQLEMPYGDLRAGLNQAVALADGLDEAARIEVLAARGLALDGPDDREEQLVIGTELQEIGRRTGDAEVILDGDRMCIPALLVLGRQDEARQLTATYAELAQQVRHPGHLAFVAMFDVLWAVVEGDYDRGEATAQHLYDQLVAAGFPDGGLIHFGQVFALRWIHGGLESIRPELERLRSADPDALIWWAATASLDSLTGHVDRALAQLAAKDPEVFVQQVHKNQLWWPTMTSCAYAAAAGAGNRRWAAVLHEALTPYAGQHTVFGYSVFAGSVDYYLGILALALGRHDQAVEQLDNSLDQHEALGATPFVALSATWLTCALARRASPGDDGRAAALRAHAAALADQLDLRGLPELAPETRGGARVSGASSAGA